MQEPDQTPEVNPLTITPPAQPPPVIWKDPADEFVYFLAHEVRNPLNNIKLSIEALEFAIKDSSLQVYLDIISRNSIRINVLIDDLLKHQETDVVPVELYSIYQMLDEVLEIAEDRIRLKNIRVTKSYQARDCKISVNAPRMKIALTNIVINAIEAMVPGNGELKLVTKLKEDVYIVQIEDNGCGIAKEHLVFIFQPYFTNKPGGLGLGLSTTYDILRANRVRVNVESEVGKGTQFMLQFEEIISP